MAPVKKNPNHDPASGPKTRRQMAKCALDLDIEKRKAHASPAVKTTKRSAFGDLTNAVENLAENGPYKNMADKKSEGFGQSKLASENCQNIDPKQKTKIYGPTSMQTTMKQFCKLVKPNVALQSKILKPKIEEVTEKIKAVSVTEKVEAVSVTEPSCHPGKQASICTTDSEDSIYVSADEELDIPKPGKTDKVISESQKGFKKITEHEVAKPEKKAVKIHPKIKSTKCDKDKEKILTKVPPGVRNHDLEVLADTFHSSVYAVDIFNYLKDKEAGFLVDNYMERQPNISPWMRALLIDWMVEVQETFEMNHETLYLAVKLVDLYLCKNTVSKETLQLVGAACLLISSKYDEQVAIGMQDILFICDGAFTRRELVRMEKNILRSVDYNLGIPLSYVFLRRYALCGRVSLKVLTMSRYILELSLMDYSFVEESESKLAASSLLLALLMHKENPWTQTLEYFSGYKVTDLKKLTERLNQMLQNPPKEKLVTIKIKYSHKSFFEVAKLDVLDPLNLQRLLRDPVPRRCAAIEVQQFQ